MTDNILFLMLIFACSTAFTQDDISPILMRYAETPAPKLSSANYQIDHSGYVLKRSFYSNTYHYTSPYNFDLSRSGNNPLPSASLIFETLGESYTSGVLESTILSKIDIQESSKTVILKMRPEVQFYRWNVNKRGLEAFNVTLSDLLFSLSLHRQWWESHGYQSFYSILESAEIDQETQEVLLNFGVDVPFSRINEMMMYIISQTKLVPESVYAGVDFERPDLAIAPVGVGFYYIKPANIDDSGNSIVYDKVPEHWRQNTHPERFEYRFEQIYFATYLDSFAHQMALQVGDISFFSSNEHTEVMSTLEIIGQDNFVATELENSSPTQIWLNFNLNRWTNPEVRKAIGLLMRDYGLVSSSAAVHGTYSLNDSMFPTSTYFDNINNISDTQISALEELGLSEDAMSLLQEPFDGILEQANNRSQRRSLIRTVLQIFESQGYYINDSGHMIDPETNERLVVKAVVSSNSLQDKIFGMVRENFQRAGIELIVSSLDQNALIEVQKEGDFDIKLSYYSFSDLPVVTYYQAIFNSNGKFDDNYGISDPNIDLILQRMNIERNLQNLKSLIAGLNRLLIGNSYMVPVMYAEKSWVIHSRDISPANTVDERVDSSVTRGWRLAD